MELPAQHGEHVHARHRLALQQDSDVVAVDLNARCLFDRHRRGLMGNLVEHGGEAEEIAMARFIDHHFLLIFIDGCNPNVAFHHDVGQPSRIADLIDALARSEFLYLNLFRQDGGFFVIQQRE